jgi:hypothetical protein
MPGRPGSLAKPFTLDPRNKAASITLSGGNLIAEDTAGDGVLRAVRAIQPLTKASGQVWFSVHKESGSTANIAAGVCNSTLSMENPSAGNYPGYLGNAACLFANNGYLAHSDFDGIGPLASLSPMVNYAVFLLDFDATAGPTENWPWLWVSMDGGTWLANSITNPASGALGARINRVGPSMYPFLAVSTGGKVRINFGTEAPPMTIPYGFVSVKDYRSQVNRLAQPIWSDPRPIHKAFIAHEPDRSATNPRGYRFASDASDDIVAVNVDGTPNTGTVFSYEGVNYTFHDLAMARAAQHVTIARNLGAQAIMVQDADGAEFNHTVSYLGHPEKWDLGGAEAGTGIAPEFSAVADDFFDALKGTGGTEFRIGMTLRLTNIDVAAGLGAVDPPLDQDGSYIRLLIRTDKFWDTANDVSDRLWYTDSYASWGNTAPEGQTGPIWAWYRWNEATFGNTGHPGLPRSKHSEMYTRFHDRVEYCVNRWGMSVFYVDSTVYYDGPAISDEPVWTEGFWRQLRADFPNVLFFPENPNFAYQRFTAPYAEGRHLNFGQGGADPNALSVVTLQQLEAEGASYTSARPILVEQFEKGRIIFLVNGEDTAPTGEATRALEVMSLANMVRLQEDFSTDFSTWSGWSRPAPGYVATKDTSIGSIESGRLRVTSSAGHEYPRRVRVIQRLKPGRLHSYSIPYANATNGRIRIGPDKHGLSTGALADSGLLTGAGTFAGTFTAGTVPLYVGLICDHEGSTASVDFESVTITEIMPS